MFVFIFATVVVNAVNLYLERRGTEAPVRRMNRYTWIALAMVVGVVAACCSPGGASSTGSSSSRRT